MSADKSIPEAVQALSDSLYDKRCSGVWVSGSGGHMVHTPCPQGAQATWKDPCDSFGYCNRCITDRLREISDFKHWPTRILSGVAPLLDALAGLSEHKLCEDCDREIAALLAKWGRG